MTLFRRLATVRTPTTDHVETRYDPEAKQSFVRENGLWVRSFDSVKLPGTKKADLETGEDQKGQ